MLRKNVSGQHIGFSLVKAIDGTACTGASVTVKRQIDGAAQASGTGTVTEAAGGQYDYALSAADLNGANISLFFTAVAAGAIQVEKTIVTTAANPTDATQVPPTNFNSLGIDSGGNVKIQTGVKKNTALANYQFVMTDSTNHNPVTGKTVTCKRVIDNGGSFVTGTLANVLEIELGMYRVDFLAADLNGGCITLRATAAGCDDALITFITMP